MAWVVDQVVGKLSGSFVKRAYKGVVTRVTKAGRADVTFTREDGGTFTGMFSPEGRPVPYHRNSSYLREWDSEMEEMFAKQCVDAEKRKKLAADNRADILRNREEIRGAADYLLELLEGKNDPRADKAREFIEKSALNYEDFS